MMRVEQRRHGGSAKLGRTSAALLTALALIAGMTASSCSSGSVANSGPAVTLTVLTSWTSDPEKGAFEKIKNTFEKAHPGIKVVVQSTRSLAAALQSDVQQNTTPDLAVMPDAGALSTYARDGVLYPLDGLADKDVSDKLPTTLRTDYGNQWYSLMQAGTGHPYAVPVKVSLKSLIWYDKHALDPQNVSTWNGLMALSSSIARTTTTPWCLALADPPASGWPGTDWIEDILLHQSGPDAYTAWAQGNLKWTSTPVRNAWLTWGEIVAQSGQVYGSATTALLTNYGSGDYPMFGYDKPQCLLGHGALVTTSPPTSAEKKLTLNAGTDYDFFDFPSLGAPQQPAYEVSGDLMGIFHDSPAADAFIAYVASPAAQTIFPTADVNEAFSASTQATNMLDKSLYPKYSVAGRISRELSDRSATQCFDASDMMPDAMTNAFYRAVLKYVQDRDPSQLDGILHNLDSVQSGAYDPNAKNLPPLACGKN